MSETAGRLSQVPAWDRPRALAAIGEAVWWVTIVDATLVRHHLHAYDTVMAGYAPGQRDLVEETLGRAAVRPEPDRRRSRPWRVHHARPEGPPGVHHRLEVEAGARSGACLTATARRAWELTRYRAYQAHLAGHTTGEVFGRAAAFLKLTAAKAMPVTDADLHAAR